MVEQKLFKSVKISQLQSDIDCPFPGFIDIAVLVLLPIASRYFLSIGNTFHMGIGNTFSVIFWQYSILILLWSCALVKSVKNITVTERVKARTVVLHLK